VPEVRFSGRVEKVVLKGASEAQVAFNEVFIGDESLPQLRALQNTGEDGTTVEVLVGICPPAQMSFNYETASGDSVGDRVAKLAGALTIYEGVLKGIGGDPGPAPTGDGAAASCSACLAHRALAASVLAEVRELLGGRTAPVEDGKVRVYRCLSGEDDVYTSDVEAALDALRSAWLAAEPEMEIDRPEIRAILLDLKPDNDREWAHASVAVRLMTREEAGKLLTDPVGQAGAWFASLPPAETPTGDDEADDDDPGQAAG